MHTPLTDATGAKISGTSYATVAAFSNEKEDHVLRKRII
jgi:hypothetical protein